MTFDSTADIDAMLEEQGQPVTVAGVTARAILNTTDLGLLAGEATEVDAGLVVFEARSDAFPGLAVGVDLVSGATTYKVLQFLRVGDGKTVHIFCEGPGQASIFGEEDVDAMLAESPVQATIAGVTAPVFYQRVGEAAQEGVASSVQATRILVTAKTGRFPGLVNGATVLLTGPGLSATYKARDVKRSGDGGLELALCEVA